MLEPEKKLGRLHFEWVFLKGDILICENFSKTGNGKFI